MVWRSSLCLSFSAWDDPAPLWDTIRQFLLCGQQAGDAQQSRLFLLWRAVGSPSPLLWFKTFSGLALMDKSLALDGHLSSQLAPHIPTQALSCLDHQIPLQEEQQSLPVRIRVHGWKRVGSTNRPLISVCICGLSFIRKREDFFFPVLVLFFCVSWWLENKQNPTMQAQEIT